MYCNFLSIDELLLIFFVIMDLYGFVDQYFKGL